MRGRRPTIALVGMRGAGKTSVGRVLAAELVLPFVDLDERTLEAGRHAGHAAGSPGELLALAGEAVFRELEAWALRGLLEPQVECVVACGGGVVEREDNRTWLARSAFVIWLQATLAALRARIAAGGSSRPPLLGSDAVAEVEELLMRRSPLYAAVADLSVPSTDGTPEDLARKIRALLPTE